MPRKPKKNLVTEAFEELKEFQRAADTLERYLDGDFIADEVLGQLQDLEEVMSKDQRMQMHRLEKAVSDMQQILYDIDNAWRRDDTDLSLSASEARYSLPSAANLLKLKRKQAALEKQEAKNRGD